MVAISIEGFDDIVEIGRGGSARVYRATQVDLDRVVAIKILHTVMDDEVIRRFERERRAMGRLSSHDGVVSVYSTGTTSEGTPYIVMPLFERGSLNEVMKTGPLGWAEACRLILATADAMAWAHQSGVVHRDLKPSNVLLADDGTPKIADFGISRLVDDGTASRSTSLTFTPAFSPPEAFTVSKPAPSADVYGLGATLWALLSGRPPFTDAQTGEADLLQLIGRVANEAVTQPPECPDQVFAVIQQSMAKNPDDRQPDGAAFGAALAAARDAALGEPVDATVAHPVAAPLLPLAVGSLAADPLAANPHAADPPSGIGAGADRGAVAGAHREAGGETISNGGDGKRRRLLVPLAIVALVIGMVGVASAALGGGDGDGDTVALDAGREDLTPQEAQAEKERLEAARGEDGEPVEAENTPPDGEESTEGGDSAQQPGSIVQGESVTRAPTAPGGSRTAPTTASTTAPPATRSGGAPATQSESESSATPAPTSQPSGTSPTTTTRPTTTTTRATTTTTRATTTTTRATTTTQALPPAPVISNVRVGNVTTTSASVFFTTNTCVAARYQYSGGSTGTHSSKNYPSNAACTTNHEARLGIWTPALVPGQRYSVAITVQDAQGRTKTGSTSFTTAQPAPPPPTASDVGIYNLRVGNVTATSASVFFTTNSCLAARYQYSGGSSGSHSSSGYPSISGCTTNHEARLGIWTPALVPGQPYTVNVTVADAEGRTGSRSISFTTSS